MTSQPPDWESRIRHKFVMMESFLRANDSFSDPVIVERLRTRTGVDVRHPQATYDRRTVLSVMNTLCDYYYPGLTRQDAYHKLGYDSFNGFRQTITGRIGLALLKLKVISAERLLKNSLEVLNSVDENAIRSMVKDSPTSLRFIYRDDPLDPFAMHGLYEAMMEAAPLKEAKAELKLLSPFNFDIIFSWKE